MVKGLPVRTSLISSNVKSDIIGVQFSELRVNTGEILVTQRPVTFRNHHFFPLAPYFVSGSRRGHQTVFSCPKSLVSLTVFSFFFPWPWQFGRLFYITFFNFCLSQLSYFDGSKVKWQSHNKAIKTNNLWGKIMWIHHGCGTVKYWSTVYLNF